MNTHNLLVALAVLHQGDWGQIYRALSEKKYPDEYEVDALYNSVKAKTLTILDEGYPSYLKRYLHPPFVLFYYGDISLLRNPDIILGVVGTRKPSPYGLENTTKLVSEVANRYIIISGMAMGVDKAAHLAAINAGGKTIAVLGTGIDVCYPSECQDIYEIMKENHLVISEYPNSIIFPSQFSFPARNRIISQISNALLVTESAPKSGTFITVSHSMSMNKDIMCLPSNDLNNSGCNLLIKEGAALVENSQDIVNVMERFLL